MILTRERLRRAETREARDALQGVLDDTGSIATLHRALGGGATADLNEMVGSLAAHWADIAARRQVCVSFTGAPLTAPHRTVSTVGTIVHELLSNAVAHGFVERSRGKIRVDLRKRGGSEAEITVADDGIGFDPDAERPRSLGLALVRGMAGQLGGTVEFTRSEGTLVRLRIPLAPEAPTRTE